MLPYCVRFGPDAGSAQRVGLVVRRLALLLRLQAVLPHSLVYRHVVGQQVVADVELQPVPHAARVQELRRLVAMEEGWGIHRGRLVNMDVKSPS